MSYDTRFIL